MSERDICAAIMKYAFVASPYPIIISAVIHCYVQLAVIMKEVFGEYLVWAPVDARPKIDILPSSRAASCSKRRTCQCTLRLGEAKAHGEEV